MCGVFGIFGHTEAANLTYLGLHALQHRGQESAGIVTTDGNQVFVHRAMGHVIDVFPQEQLEKLPGSAAIGHVRYSTTGGSHAKNAQPLAVEYSRGSIAIGHNGNLTNAEMLREKLEANGSIFQSAGDTEVIVHLVARSTQRAMEDRVADALNQVEGAFSLLALNKTTLVAARDPRGIRPLCLGRVRKNGAYVVASESTSFDLIGAEFIREVDPGEMLVITAEGIRSTRPFERSAPKLCIFEHVYFARPDSTIDGVNVYEARKNLGRRLADEHPVEADVAIPVPDSGVPATIGYAERAGIPFEMGLVRSHYIGRTFIEPEQRIRHFGVKLKLNAISHTLKGKRVVVIDDSIVRGTTSRKIVKMVREAGAKEVHLRISSPPNRWPCYYGIDTPTRSELIASNHSLEEINNYVTSDSLGYLSLEGMVSAVVQARAPEEALADKSQQFGRAAGALNGNSLPLIQEIPLRERFCHACWSGDYPIEFHAPAAARQMELLDI